MNYGFEIICASVFTVVCVISARIYSLINKRYTYWDRKNVKGPRPHYVFGTWKGFAETFLGSEDHSNSLKYGKVFGLFDGLTPNLAITDPDVIKEILDSSSKSFQDLRVSSENSVILKDSLMSLSGTEKSEIQMLTNSLLNPHKLGKIIPRLESSVKTLIHKIDKSRQEDNRLNVTSTVSEFIDEVIALAIFGIELDADIQFKDDFVKHTKTLLNVKTPKSIMSLLPFLYENYFKKPWICPENTLQYFVQLILNGISESPKQDSIPEGKTPNLIELMVAASEEEKKLVKSDKSEEEQGETLILKENVIISKSIASILSLSSATKTSVIMGLYALANDEEVQEKLLKEVHKIKAEKISENLSYENIQNLNYLDKVVKEILRLYPYEFRLERISTQNVKIGEIDLDKEIRVSIPLYALHQSEEFYPEPEKFDPERFSHSVSEKRIPFTYLPFGQSGINGSDISIQFGILATKIVLVMLVEKFKFSGAQPTGIYSLFEKGFTRIPRPHEIDLIVENRVKEEIITEI